nr:MAG TPA: hypothetical protein [Caudoviricetes sp.]
MTNEVFGYLPARRRIGRGGCGSDGRTHIGSAAGRGRRGAEAVFG